MRCYYSPTERPTTTTNREWCKLTHDDLKALRKKLAYWIQIFLHISTIRTAPPTSPSSTAAGFDPDDPVNCELSTDLKHIFSFMQAIVTDDPLQMIELLQLLCNLLKRDHKKISKKDIQVIINEHKNSIPNSHLGRPKRTEKLNNILEFTEVNPDCHQNTIAEAFLQGTVLVLSHCIPITMLTKIISDRQKWPSSNNWFSQIYHQRRGALMGTTLHKGDTVLSCSR